MFSIFAHRRSPKAAGIILCCAVLTFASTLPALAQQSEIDALAAQLAEQIAKSGKKRVVVIDFEGPDGKPLPLGTWLADQFSISLAKAGKGLEVIDRARLKAAFEERHISSRDMRDPDIARPVTKSLRADVIVAGGVEGIENAIRLSVSAAKVSRRLELIDMTSGKVPLSPEMAALLPAPLGARPEPDVVQKPGEIGATYPTCQYCPPPDSPKGRRKGFQGVVALQVTITADGRATDITIMKSAGTELDKKAGEAVQKWKFTPAIGPGGKAVPVRVLIEVRFRLM